MFREFPVLASVLAAAALLAPGAARALSCIAPDIVRSYEMARDSTELYSIVEGRLTLDGPAPERGRVAARLAGNALASGGFTTPVSRRVVVELSCLGPWCGGAPDAGRRIYFLRHSGTERIIEIGPCDAAGFEATPSSRARLLSCHFGGSCLPKDRD